VTVPPFQPLGLDHLLLHVRGMAGAEEFYCGVLGCTVKSRMPQWGMLELSAGVTLVDTDDPNGAWALEGAAPGRNLDHFAIATSAWDETEMRDWLAGHSITIEEERAEEASLSFYVRDPSGNLLELIRRA
jgi:catechol 2,3-dioxygenase-like lactoylglutathione lyase family enzyme